MAYNGIIVTEAEMEFMAGAGVDAVGSVEANHNFLARYAEGFLSNLVKYDIVTNWAALSTIYRDMLTEWAARYSGIQLILFDTSGYSDRIEAEDMVNVHLFRMSVIEQLLNDSSVQDFIQI